MNRIIIVGNGFDLAHGLKTSYKDFINWYWEQKVEAMKTAQGSILEDLLCSIQTPPDMSWVIWASNQGYFRFQKPKDVINHVLDERNGFTIIKTHFFERITTSIETQGWVDIENEYYQLLSNNNISKDFKIKLNVELDYLRNKLIEYLQQIPTIPYQEKIKKLILAPINHQDIAISNKTAWEFFIKNRLSYTKGYWSKYGKYFNPIYEDSQEVDWIYEDIQKCKDILTDCEPDYDKVPQDLFLPDNVLLLNFNYTTIADLYLPEAEIFSINHIHGELKQPESVIFGYGDELDEHYKELVNKNENAYLQNIKSIKYLESDRYRKLLSFINSDTYQIYIMGHSCGNSDRTLLNTLFEHPNCVSIKPFYYQKNDGTDNYTEIVQNISRNFTDMKRMRDVVVNKTYCKPFSFESSKQ